MLPHVCQYPLSHTINTQVQFIQQPQHKMATQGQGSCLQASVILNEKTHGQAPLQLVQFQQTLPQPQ